MFWTVIVVAVFVVVLTTSLSLRSSHSNASNNHGNTYPSRDTAIVGYSNKFCDRLHIDGSGYSAEKVQLTLYLLKAEPTITKQELISFAKMPYINRKYEYWLFHLLPNSKITLTACTQSGSTATFFFIKGVKNFRRWEDDGNSHVVEKSLDVHKNCPSSGSDNVIFYEYDVHSNDQYYIVYENEYGSSTLQLTFNITQVLYTVSSDIVADNCSISLNTYESCSMPVAYSSNYSKALLQLDPMQGSTIDWEANNVVNVKCHERAWLYAVICLFSAAGVILLVVGVAGTCLVIYRRNKVKRNITNNSTTTTTTTMTHAATVAGNDDTKPLHAEPSAPTTNKAPLIMPTEQVNENPPPYNYNYSTLPPYQP